MASIAYITTVFEVRIMNPQIAAFELAWFTMEEIHECQMTRSCAFAGIVAVEMKIVPVVAGGDLRFDVGKGEVFHAQFLENVRQHCLYAFDDSILMRA